MPARFVTSRRCRSPSDVESPIEGLSGADTTIRASAHRAVLHLESRKLCSESVVRSVSPQHQTVVRRSRIKLRPARPRKYTNSSSTVRTLVHIAVHTGDIRVYCDDGDNGPWCRSASCFITDAALVITGNQLRISRQ